MISDCLFLNALIYILIDLAPLMIYFPVLILFNVNLASGPGQSFLFFNQAITVALTAATEVDFFWGLLTMQSTTTSCSPVLCPILQRVKRSRRGSAQSEATVQATSSEVTSSEVYFDMAELDS